MVIDDEEIAEVLEQGTGIADHRRTKEEKAKILEIKKK